MSAPYGPPGPYQGQQGQQGQPAQPGQWGGGYASSGYGGPAGYQGFGPTASGGPQPAARRTATPRPALDLGKLLALAVGGLGVLNFIWGFLPYLTNNTGRTSESVSVFGFGPAYAPVLFLVAGVMALAPFLPKAELAPLLVAVLSAGTAIAVLVATISDGLLELVGGSENVNRGAGLILLLITGLLQAVLAVAAYLFGSGVIKPSHGLSNLAASGSGGAQSGGGQASGAYGGPPSAPSGYGAQGYGPYGYGPGGSGYVAGPGGASRPDGNDDQRPDSTQQARF